MEKRKEGRGKSSKYGGRKEGKGKSSNHGRRKEGRKRKEQQAWRKEGRKRKEQQAYRKEGRKEEQRVYRTRNRKPRDWKDKQKDSLEMRRRGLGNEAPK
ncbi:hypothetical protein Pcinc_031918 [Petrolisthes cinctipes]|uniref:Uncharacterized protein n=1 Tax=Petrolisthes cinctipes TaxID=88211 RepID=A0AAE1K452_PETCI|nr:hypothetical protein Pcinc_031918 [Petrolisthes cinctipes]